MTGQETPRRGQFLIGAGAAAGATLTQPLRTALAAPAKPEKAGVRVGTSTDIITFLPIYIGADRTWKEQGLDNQLFPFRADGDAAQALAGGSTDVSVQSVNALVELINAGQPVTGFYAGFDQAMFKWIAAPSIKTWADLKGKAVGVSTFGSLTDALTRYALQKNHLDPEQDVQIVQVGGSPNSLQAIKSGRIAMGILSPPFTWQAQDQGLRVLGAQSDIVAPSWPQHIFIAKTSFINDNPNTILALLRAHVAALRLARTNRDYAIGIIMNRLKYSKADADRAYDLAMPGFDERGLLPEKAMPTFWEITISLGTVKESWPESKFLSHRFIDTFKQWAP